MAHSKKSPPFRFGYSTIHWPGTTEQQTIFAEMREAGWSAVELFGHSVEWLGAPEDLRAALAGLTVATSFGSIAVPVEPAQLERHKQNIDYAAGLGAAAYGLVGGSRPKDRTPTAEEYSNLATACEELAVYAADKDMLIGYHPHTNCTIETESETDILLNQSPHVRLCLDPSHIAQVGEDPLAQLRKYRDRVGYVHLKDWGDGKFQELGRGDLGIDFAAILDELEAWGYDGWVIVEQSRSRTDVAALDSARINADFLRNLGYTL